MTDVVTSPASSQELADRLLAAYHAHDPSVLSRLYAPDAVIRVGELEFRGRESVAEFWAEWFAAFPDVGSEIERTFVEAGRFALEWTERGTHRGPLRMGDLTVPPRGRSLCWRGVSIYEVTDGQIVSVDYHVDRLAAAEQLVRPVAVVLALAARVSAALRGGIRARRPRRRRA